MHRYYSLSAPGTFALYHDNEGDYIPSAAGGSSGCYSGSSATQCGLHNAYESGDIGLLNAQGSGSGTAQAGASRLAGFTCGPPPSSPFCLVSDDATGGNNAWAMLALLDEYGQTGNTTYLNDAITIGNWIVANLEDNSGTGYGGYYAGYFGFDSNMHGVINFGKSTENNADIFAAFTALASAESKLGNQSAATRGLIWPMSRATSLCRCSILQKGGSMRVQSLRGLRHHRVSAQPARRRGMMLSMSATLWTRTHLRRWRWPGHRGIRAR